MTLVIPRPFGGLVIPWVRAQPAYPVVESSATSGTSAASSHTANLPSGITAGDLLLLFVAASAGAARTVTTPSGWTEIYNEVGPGDLRRAIAYYKIAAGSEGSTLGMTGSGNINWAVTALRISGFSGVPEVSSSASGTDTSPDPASLSPSWGSGDTLWIAACHQRVHGTDPTLPSGYGSLVTATSGSGTSHGRMSTATRNVTASSENPGAFGLSASANWVARTLAIRQHLVPVLTYIGKLVSTSAGAVHTFTSQNIGAAASDRLVIAALSGNNNTYNVDIALSGLTIGGNAAAILRQDRPTSYPGNASISQLLVPSGTTATIVATYSDVINVCACHVYTLTNYALAAPHHSAGNNYTASANSLSASLDIRTDGAAIAVVAGQSGSADLTSTWSGLTEDADTDGTGYGAYSVASGSVMSAQAGRTISATLSANSDRRAITAVSWG